jgi:hypothetical protein
MARSGRPWLLAVGALAVVLVASGFSAARSSVSVRWGKALTVGGVAKSGNSVVGAISCASPGNCLGSGGFGSQAFVVSQVRGTWGSAKVIPGTARTSKPASSVNGIACLSGGCVVVGSYTDGGGQTQAFIANLVHGTWRKIIWVPGLARLNKGHNAGLGYLSCVSAGNCAAEGTYTDAKGTGRQFTVSQVRGAWGHAAPVPSLAGLPGQVPGTVPSFGPISCASPGNCAAAGTYQVAGGNQAYVDDDENGTWGAPEPVPGLAALNTGLYDSIGAISCPSPGNCGAGGSYIDAETGDNADSFVVSETHGTWGPATEVKTKILGFNADDGDWITNISCPSVGNCVAGGQDSVERSALASQVFFVSQTHGTWGEAIPVPGTPKLNQGDQAGIGQITCSSAGSCGAAGWYSAAYAYGFDYTQPFVITQAHGTWGNAIGVPGIKIFPPKDGQFAQAFAISCPAANRCSAGGYYQDLNGHSHAFVDSQP